VLNEFTYGPNFKLDEEMEEQLIVKAYKALKAAKLVELWYLQQKSIASNDGIDGIRRQISLLEVARQIERQEGRQSKLDSWLTKP
jgi:hypothetical protein